MKPVRTVTIMRSLTKGERRPWDEFKQRGGPLVKFLTELDMDSIEIRLGTARAGPGVTPSHGSKEFVTPKEIRKARDLR
jgi:hypothetical protein